MQLQALPTVPSLDVNHPGWLQAFTYELCGHIFMEVHRSLELSYGGEYYRPVAEILERFDWDTVHKAYYNDDLWWSGRVELSTYAYEIPR